MTKLEWCRTNAPEALRCVDDVTLLECMTSSYEKFVLSDITFVDYRWEPYDTLEVRSSQIQHIWGSYLCEPNEGVEFSFVPTTKMLEREKTILRLYKELRVEDNAVTLCNEIYYTSKIEGAKTTIKRTQEIHDGCKIDTSNFSESMVLGGFNATKLLNLYSNKIDVDKLLNVWNVLVENCCSNQDICGDRFRIGNVQVGNHVGLNHELVEEAMLNWVNYHNNDILRNHPFIKAALLHFAFEYIHPFCDGNGRLGRLLLVNYLIGEGYEKLKAVSFSKTIDSSRARYDYAFEVSENVYTDCTFFIEYMLEVMIKSLLDALGKDISYL